MADHDSAGMPGSEHELHPWMAEPGSPGTPMRDRKRKRTDREWLVALRLRYGHIYDINFTRRWVLFRVWAAWPTTGYEEAPLTARTPGELARKMRRRHARGLREDGIPAPRPADDTLEIARTMRTGELP